MKKSMSVLLILLMMGTLFAGCGQTDEEGQDTTTMIDSNTSDSDTTSETDEKSNSDTSEEVDAEIYMFISMPEYAEAIETLIAEYKTVKPNVTINYETTQNDYPTLLKTKLNSGEAPDIFSSTSGKEIGVYLDYSANLANQPLAEAMSDPVKNVMKSGDEVHGLSIKGNFFGIVYNKGIFEEVGITEFPQTLSELESAAIKIEDAGYQAFTSGFAEWWVFKHVFQHYLDAAQPENVEGLVNAFINGEAKMQDYPELYNDFFNFIDLVVKYGDDKILEADLSTEIAALASGQTAMVVGQGAWIEADVLKIDPNISIGFDGYPINDNPDACKVIAGSDQAVRIYKDSDVLDETLDFVNWWYTSDYGKSWFSDVAGVIPPITEGVAPDFEIIKQGNVHVNNEGAGTLGVVYSTDSFHQAFGEIMQGYIAGVKNKDQTCQEIETKWVELEGNN